MPDERFIVYIAGKGMNFTARYYTITMIRYRSYFKVSSVQPEVKEKRYMIIDDNSNNGVINFNEGFIKSVFHKDSITKRKDLVEKLRNVVFADSEIIIKNCLLKSY